MRSRNAVDEDQAKSLYEEYAVPGSGEPLFQVAAANLNPWSEAKVDSKSPDRGPLLIVSGVLDHTVPWAIANASYKREKRNPGVTEIVEMKGRGHSLTIDQWLARGRRHCPRLRQTLRVGDRLLRPTVGVACSSGPGGSKSTR